MGNLTTTHDMTLNYYNEFGDYNVFSKQYDTNRYINFEFTEEVIPPDRDDHFHVFVRGQYPNGGYIPFSEIIDGENGNEINDDNVLFHIPQYLLMAHGRVKCDLVMARITDDIDLVVNPDGTVENADKIEILSTHSFFMQVEPMATVGGNMSPQTQDSVDTLLQYILAVQSLDDQMQASEAIRQANEQQRIEQEQFREDRERGYVRQAEQWADIAQARIDGYEYVHLQIEDDGHLYMYKSGDTSNVSFQLSDDHKNLEVVFYGG